MPKQDSRKSITATNASKEKNNIIDGKSPGFNKHKQMSGKKRTKYTKLFDMANVTDKPNTRIRTPLVRNNPETVRINSQVKSVTTTDFALSVDVLSKKIAEKPTVEPIASVNKKNSKILILSNFNPNRVLILVKLQLIFF
jgi:hypothetical protein